MFYQVGEITQKTGNVVKGDLVGDIITAFVLVVVVAIRTTQYVEIGVWAVVCVPVTYRWGVGARAVMKQVHCSVYSFRV
jgi:hypothetical protein